MGETEISGDFRAKLEQDLDNFQSALSTTIQKYTLCLNNYNESMQSTLDAVEEYYRQDEMMNRHQNKKNQSMTQV